jgi:hypothetical protein
MCKNTYNKVKFKTLLVFESFDSINNFRFQVYQLEKQKKNKNKNGHFERKTKWPNN